MNPILYAIISVTAIGAICAIILCVASKVMAVHVDERIASITNVLPGANCGACGYPGCSGYAEALVSGAAARANLCTPGGDAAVEQISAILGIKAEKAEKKVAIVHCAGDQDARSGKKMEYVGIETCYAAKQLYGGESACAFGCLGYGDCRDVCPQGAICVEGKVARINPELCNGCGMCAKACPKKIISIIPASATTVILCSNTEKGAVARKKCSKACLGCRKCARDCISEAIAVEDNLARIDYDKCTSCGHCAEVCVMHTIERR